MSEPLPGRQDAEATNLEDLLQPSLGDGEGRRVAIYSVQSNVLVAFFGGPFALSLFLALSARRLQTLTREALPLALVWIIWAAVTVWCLDAFRNDAVPEWLSALGSPQRGFRAAGKILALAVYGAYYLRWRHLYKSQALAGIDPPSAWIPGIGAIAFGAVTFFIIFAIGMPS